MTYSGARLRCAAAFTLAAALALGTQVCLADAPEPAPREPRTATGHLIGDTVARGAEIVLKPVHLGLSGAYFLFFTPPAPRHITSITMQDSPAPQQPRPRQ